MNVHDVLVLALNLKLINHTAIYVYVFAMSHNSESKPDTIVTLPVSTSVVSLPYNYDKKNHGIANLEHHDFYLCLAKNLYFAVSIHRMRVYGGRPIVYSFYLCLFFTVNRSRAEK